MSYNANVYTKQGGNERVIASGGYVTVESGGYIDVQSGAYLAMPVVTRTTTNVATSIPAYCHASITASTTAPNYTLDAPSAGKMVSLRVVANTSSGTCTVTTTAGFDSAGSKNKLKFDAVDDAVILAGVSSTGWAIVGNVGSVATTSG